MTKDSLIASVGRERYERASRRLGPIASRTGHEDVSGDYASDLIHDVSPLIWEAPLSDTAKVRLFFDVYDDLPSYGMLMYAKFSYSDLDIESRALWWMEVRNRIETENPCLRDPIVYALWCDFFEDPSTVREAWLALTVSRKEPLIRAALSVSGPVPWDLKQPLLEELSDVSPMQDAVFDALVGSAFDYFGQIDKVGASRLLVKLKMPVTTPRYSELTKKLSSS